VRVSAIVIAWNPGERIDTCLRSLAEQDHDDLEVIVVDNASTDGTVALIDDRHPDVRLLANADNLGFAAAANQGYDVATGDAIMTVNPDVVATPGFVSALVAGLDEATDVGSVAGLLVRPDGTVDSAGHEVLDTRLFVNRGAGGSPDDYDQPAWVFGATGAAGLYRRVALEDAAAHDPAGRPWDEACFAYVEDVDLDWRLTRLGWRCRYRPDAVAVHERGVAHRAVPSFVEMLNWRNRWRVVWRNDDLADLAAHLPGVALTAAVRGAGLLRTHPDALLEGTLGVRLGRRPSGRGGRIAMAPFDYAAWSSGLRHKLRES
jgi:GT2 family glycosyltransferase